MSLHISRHYLMFWLLTQCLTCLLVLVNITKWRENNATPSEANKELNTCNLCQRKQLNSAESITCKQTMSFAFPYLHSRVDKIIHAENPLNCDASLTHFANRYH